MLAAGCTYRDVKPLPAKKDPTNYHADVPSLTTPTKGLWSTNPPSGGAHYGLWAVWDFYTDPVNPRQVVHNEEHGGVIIWYGPDVLAGDVEKLQSFYNEQTTGVLGTPYAGARQQDRAHRLDGQPGRLLPQRLDLLRDRPHRDLPELQREGLRGLPRRLPRQGPGRHPASSDTAGMGPQ